MAQSTGENRVKVQCPGCQTSFTISDAKVEERSVEGKALRINCPKCRAPMDITSKPAEPESHHEPAGSIGDSPDFLADYAASIDVVEEGVKTALLCVANVKHAESFANLLQELDFWVVHSGRAAFALGKLHHNTYDLIILEEKFDSSKASDNLVLHHVQLLPMHARRRFYLCLLSDTLPTMDAMLAFRMGVNLILNVRDLDKTKIILARSLKEYKSFYGFYNSELNRKMA